MCCNGKHEIKKVCMDKDEETSMIAFVIDPDEKCGDRTYIADELINKGVNYMKKIGLGDVAGLKKNKYNKEIVKP